MKSVVGASFGIEITSALSKEINSSTISLCPLLRAERNSNSELDPPLHTHLPFYFKEAVASGISVLKSSYEY